MLLEFIKLRARSFKHAFAGWWYVISTQKNTWIHVTATLMVILFALWLNLNTWDWALLFVVIGMVWIAEFLNTALEAVVDLASPEKHPLAKVGKDVGAAAVLLSALVAILVGILILCPPLLQKLRMFGIH
jgi:diacylglycerol kinase (ATP)